MARRICDFHTAKLELEPGMLRGVEWWSQVLRAVSALCRILRCVLPATYCALCYQLHTAHCANAASTTTALSVIYLRVVSPSNANPVSTANTSRRHCSEKALKETPCQVRQPGRNAAIGFHWDKVGLHWWLTSCCHLLAVDCICWLPFAGW